jgi:hypothetical protein
MKYFVSNFAHLAHDAMSDNAYLYEQVPQGDPPAHADGDPGEPGRPSGQPTIRGVITALDSGTSERRVARFQRTDASEFAASSAELNAAGGQTEPVPLLADISLPTLQVSTAPPLEAGGKGVLHRLWRLTPGGCDELRSMLTNCKLTLAGSEGLWDALLHYHVSGSRTGATPSGPGVTVLVIAREHRAEILRPVHRVVRDLPGFQAGEMVRVVRENFFFEDVTRSMPRLGGCGPHFDPGTAKALLRPVHPGELTMLAITAHSSFRLHSEAGWADTVLAHVSPKLRECASVQLHEIILDRRLGIPYRTRPDGLQETSDHVVHESNMTAAVRAVANGGELLPARSTQLDLGLKGLLEYVVD